MCACRRIFSNHANARSFLSCASFFKCLLFFFNVCRNIRVIFVCSFVTELPCMIANNRVQHVKCVSEFFNLLQEKKRYRQQISNCVHVSWNVLLKYRREEINPFSFRNGYDFFLISLSTHCTRMVQMILHAKI